MENTRLSEQYFPAVQKFVLFDLGLTLLPVGGQTEASQLIAQMVSSEDTPPTVMPSCGDTLRCSLSSTTDFSNSKLF